MGVKIYFQINFSSLPDLPSCSRAPLFLVILKRN
jgi:hypothetical protein